MKKQDDEKNGVIIGKTILKIRKQKNISQTELQDAANLSNGYISRLEQGEFESPKLTQIINIAKALGMTLRDLLECAGLITPESTFEGTLRARGANDAQVQEIKRMADYVLKYSTKSNELSS